MDVEREIIGGHPHQFRSIWEYCYLLEKYNDLTLVYEPLSVAMNIDCILEPQHSLLIFNPHVFATEPYGKLKMCCPENMQTLPQPT